MKRDGRRSERGLTPLELAAAFAIGGSILAVAVPTFVRNLHASRFVEPVAGLAAIANGAVAYAVTHGGVVGSPATTAFPKTVALTPPVPPRAHLIVDPPGTWSDPTWVALGFPATAGSLTGGSLVDGDPHAFAFGFDSVLTPARSSFVAHAHADLDGDGTTSTFEVRGHDTGTEGAVIEPGMYVDAELE